MTPAARKSHDIKKSLKTASEVKAEFQRRGASISAWACSKGINPSTVHRLLNGDQPGLRGQAHRAAVLLGLKDGVVDEVKQ
jgi:gp16 family phage-associated protein